MLTSISQEGKHYLGILARIKNSQLAWGMQGLEDTKYRIMETGQARVQDSIHDIINT